LTNNGARASVRTRPVAGSNSSKLGVEWIAVGPDVCDHLSRRRPRRRSRDDAVHSAPLPPVRAEDPKAEPTCGIFVLVEEPAPVRAPQDSLDRAGRRESREATPPRLTQERRATAKQRRACASAQLAERHEAQIVAGRVDETCVHEASSRRFGDGLVCAVDELHDM
jgi:hypothetical protein